ncbi:hypothetical protein [Nonomuraea soli]|uniref:Secreted protein n=1 Tax=Nonomuraea soli TaxID=1032476 RepID=A0A7W0CT71_9ACTN|nr:hypothetical protein [Nonomuraea soli]MBA2896882.1 hypothetical protein [Nonomuraea soli]
MRRVCCLLVVFLVLAGSAPAAAHVVSAGADLRVALTIGGSELTVVVEGVRRVPAPLRVRVEAYHGGAPERLALELRSVTDGRTATGAVRPSGMVAGDVRPSGMVAGEVRPSSAVASDVRPSGVVAGDAGLGDVAELRAEQAGPYELRLSAAGESAVLPFRVLVERGASWELVIYGALLAAALLAVGGLLTGAVARRRAGMLVSAGIAAFVAIAATFVVLEPYLPVADPDGAQPTAGPRPFARALVTTVPAEPVAGQDYTLRLDLVDGATGVPVDDLAVHHEALAHLVVTSQDGVSFSHSHPLRTAPGRLEVRLRAERPGRHLVHVELERQESGGQLLTGEFTVADRDEPPRDEPPREEPGPGETTTGPVGAAPRMVPAVPVAGRPTTVEVDTVAAARPWLGMAGHLIVRSADGAFLGHVHEMGTGGPTLRFTFGFPAPGRYLAWAQYATGERIVTVPFVVEVPR